MYFCQLFFSLKIENTINTLFEFRYFFVGVLGFMSGDKKRTRKSPCRRALCNYKITRVAVLEPQIEEESF